MTSIDTQWDNIRKSLQREPHDSELWLNATQFLERTKKLRAALFFSDRMADLTNAIRTNLNRYLSNQICSMFNLESTKQKPAQWWYDHGRVGESDDHFYDTATGFPIEVVYRTPKFDLEMVFVPSDMPFNDSKLHVDEVPFEEPDGRLNTELMRTVCNFEDTTRWISQDVPGVYLSKYPLNVGQYCAHIDAEHDGFYPHFPVGMEFEDANKLAHELSLKIPLHEVRKLADMLDLCCNLPRYEPPSDSSSDASHQLFEYFGFFEAIHIGEKQGYVLPRANPFRGSTNYTMIVEWVCNDKEQFPTYDLALASKEFLALYGRATTDYFSPMKNRISADSEIQPLLANTVNRTWNQNTVRFCQDFSDIGMMVNRT